MYTSCMGLRGRGPVCEPLLPLPLISCLLSLVSSLASWIFDVEILCSEGLALALADIEVDGWFMYLACVGG